VRLLPATVEHLVALRCDPASFGQLIGSPVPEGWPEFSESIDFTLERLREHPGEGGWWMHFVVVDEALVGSGGFVGPPEDGIVEIGYEIAPAFRGKGFGVAAARALIDKASTHAAVTMVVANTLAHDNPSTGVLRRLGFGFVHEIVDPDEGTLWRWELPIR
jgi:[ribosomal protein S5]-alanine N-acetyltransferase